jgi:hypothetical protein
MYQAELDYKLNLDERNAHLLPLGVEKEEPELTITEQIRDELSGRGFAASDELIAEGISDYNAHGGKGDF